MPTSLKQLDQRYESVGNNINDAKEYTIQNLRSNINLDVPAFYTDLGSSNLEQLGLIKFQYVVYFFKLQTKR